MTTTDELVERLQGAAAPNKCGVLPTRKLYSEAATALLAQKAEIERLTKEGEGWKPKVRWEGNTAFVGEINIGEIVFRKNNNEWDIYINHIACGVLHEPDEPSARAAVERAAMEMLMKESSNAKT